MVALLLLDLDHFKRVNDLARTPRRATSCSGHGSERLLAWTRSTTIVARLGGTSSSSCSTATTASVTSRVAGLAGHRRAARSAAGAGLRACRDGQHRRSHLPTRRIRPDAARSSTPTSRCTGPRLRAATTFSGSSQSMLEETNDKSRSVRRAAPGDRRRRAVDRLPAPARSGFREARADFEVLARWHVAEYGVVGPDRFIAGRRGQRHDRPLGVWVLSQACARHRGDPTRARSTAALRRQRSPASSRVRVAGRDHSKPSNGSGLEPGPAGAGDHRRDPAWTTTVARVTGFLRAGSATSASRS